VIGVSDETLPKVASFLFQTHKGDGKLQNDRTNYILTTDPDQSVKKDYFAAAGQRGIPCSFIIGKEGHVEWIGHPMGIDEPQSAVVHGSWNRDEFKSQWESRMAGERAMMRMQNELRETASAGDWDKHFQLIDDALKANPSDLNLLYTKFSTQLTRANRPDAGYQTGEQLLEKGWDNGQMLNAISWFVVDNKDVARRDLDFALKAATRTNDLTDEEPAFIDTLARVYYEMGDLKGAIKWQKKAVEHNQGNRSIDATLKKYEAEKALQSADSSAPAESDPANGDEQ
jgi:hypothetical protein